MLRNEGRVYFSNHDVQRQLFSARYWKRLSSWKNFEYTMLIVFVDISSFRCAFLRFLGKLNSLEKWEKFRDFPKKNLVMIAFNGISTLFNKKFLTKPSHSSQIRLEIHFEPAERCARRSEHRVDLWDSGNIWTQLVNWAYYYHKIFLFRIL